jgi:hypothetical protein
LDSSTTIRTYPEETTKVIGRHEGHQSKQWFSVTIPTPLHKKGKRVAALNVTFL